MKRRGAEGSADLVAERCDAAIRPESGRSGSARLALETTLKLKGVSQIVQPTTARSSLYGAASDSEVLRGRAGLVFDLLGTD